MSTSQARTAGHWRVVPGIDVFDILTGPEPGTLHCHATYNLGCVLAGEAQLDIAGRSFPQPVGSVVLLNAFEAHASSWLGSDNRYFVIYIRDELWASIADRAGLAHASQFSDPLVHDNILFYALKGFWSELQARPDSVSVEDVVNIVRLVASRGRTNSSELLTPPLEADTILKNLSPHESLEQGDGAVRVEEVAAKLGMSRYQLSRICQSTLGMQPRRLKLQLMVARAQVEISQGATLSEAALLAGFSDQSHMTREFRKTVGMTPREYQDVFVSGEIG